MYFAKIKIRTEGYFKSWISFERISIIFKRNKLLKKYKKSGLETDKGHHQSMAKELLRKLYQIKRKHIFEKLIENIIDNSEKLWGFFRS